MSSMQDILRDLSEGRPTPEQASITLASLEDPLRVASGPELGLMKANLLDVLLPMLKNKANDKQFSEFVHQGAGLIFDYVIDKDLTLEQGVEIKVLGLRLFATSSVAKVRVVGLEILQKLFSAATNMKEIQSSAESLDVEGILKKHLFNILSQSSRPSGSLIKAVNQTMGCLCETYPEELRKYSDNVKHFLVSQLNEQITSKASKLDLTVVEGCFLGLNGCLQAYGLDSSNESDRKKMLYENLVKVCVKPEKSQNIRRMAMRAGLELFARHCALFADLLIKESDARHWFDTLQDWSMSFNSQDHKIGFKCLDAFLRVVGQAFKSFSSGNNNSTFAYLMKAFTNILKSKKSTSKEATLAVQGYSHLAAACRIILGGEQVNVMLLELVQKTEDVFLSVTTSSTPTYDNQAVHLPSYVESLANVLAEANPPVESAVMVSIERIVVYLIKQFPRLPVQYHPFALRAFSRFFDVLKMDGIFIDPSDTVVKDVIYQGLVQTCSHPIVSDTEDILSMESESITSTKSYFPLWTGLIVRRNIYDSLLEAIIQILEKLDFSIENVPEIHESAKMEVDDVINDSVLNESLSENEKDVSKIETSLQELESKKPRKVKDFTVLANLADLAKYCLPRCEVDWFKSWFFRLVFSVVRRATSNPEVSGLYSFLSLALQIAGENYFEGQDQEGTFLLSYLEELVLNCVQFQQDLLKAGLELILDLPVTFVKPLLPKLVGPLRKVFSVTLPVKLIEKGIDSLTKWYTTMDHQEMGDLVSGVIPSLKYFMKETCSEMLEESVHLAESGTKQKSKRWKAKKTSSLDESDYERVQKKMLIFFGTLETKLQRHLVPTVDELGHLSTAIDIDRHLPFPVPFPDVKPVIHLDNLLTRVVYLSVHAKHRKTRVAACECLHVITVFVVGRSAKENTYLRKERSLVGIFKIIFPTLIKLAGDDDRVIKELFDPLLFQIIHWFTRHGKYESKETMCLLEAIFDALCDDQDAALRSAASKYFREFFCWSIKQTPPDLPVGAIHHPKSALKRIEGMWVHPDPARRQAASLAFNAIYRQFREEKELVEHFTLELAVHCILSLAMGDGDRKHPLNAEAINQVKSSLDHLLRILSEKSGLFTTMNPKRRKPKELSGSNLSDLILWTIKWTSRPETEARHKAMETLYRLTQKEDFKQTFKTYLKDKHVGSLQNYLKFVECRDFANNKGTSKHQKPATKTFDAVVVWLNWLTAVTECYTWMLDRELSPVECLVSDDESTFLSSLNFFIEQLQEKATRSNEYFCQGWCNHQILTPRQVVELNESSCTLLIRLFDLIVSAVSRSPPKDGTVVGKLVGDSTWKIICLSFVAPTELGFDVRMEEIKTGLKTTVSKMVKSIRGKFGQLMPTESFASFLPDHLKPEAVLESIWSKKNLILASDYIRGLQEVHRLSLADVSTYLPSAKEFFEKMARFKGVSLKPIFKDTLSSLLDAVLSLSSHLPPVDILAMFVHVDFEQILLKHVQNQSSLILPWIGKNLSNDAEGKKLLNVLMKIAKFCLKENDKTAASQLSEILFQSWKSISSLAECSKENMLFTIHFMKHLFMLDKKCPEKNTLVFEWIVAQLSFKQHSLKMKNRILDILPPFLDINFVAIKNRDDQLMAGLHKLSELNFPLRSTENVAGSNVYLDYVTTFHKLAQTFEETASVTILNFMIEIAAREESHVSLDRIRSSLMEVTSGTRFKSTTSEHLIKLLDIPFNMFSDAAKYPAEIRSRIMSHFLLPMLDGVKNSRVQENFHASHIEFVLSSLLLPSVGGTELERTNRLVTKSGAFKMVARLYGNAPSNDLVHTANSSVTKRAFHFLVDRREIPHDAKFSGREMSQFLVRKLQSVRADIIDGSDALKEAFRICQCDAFNTIMSVISRLQNQEKFYTIIFKEESSKAEYIWQRIIDQNLTMNFPLEIEHVSTRRTKVVAIRRSQKQGQNFNENKYLSSHYLGDSSLSQDVTSFDFHESLATLSSSIPDSSSNSSSEMSLSGTIANEIEIEVDPLNDHECMAHLIRLIQFMRDENIYDASAVDKLPGWMEQIRSKLRDDSTHQNIKLFLLRLIQNCADIFRPFAKHFGREIITLLASGNTWPANQMINYFSLDLIVMLLSWSEDYTPVGSLSERGCASVIMDQLASAANNPRREIVRYLLHIIRFMVEVWKPCLNITYGSIYKLFARSGTGSTSLSETSEIGIQLLGIILANGMSPYQQTTMVTEEKFFLDLAKNLEARLKQVYQPAAEVIGMILSFYDPNDISQKRHSDEDRSRLEKVSEIAKNQLTSLRNVATTNGDATSRQKFVDCLYKVFLHYPKIVSHFANGFIYNLRQSQLKGDSLGHCLEMLTGAVDYLNENVLEGSQWKKELGMIGVEHFINTQNSSHQLMALNFVEKVIPKIKESGDIEFISKLCDTISPLSEHSSFECREKTLDIMRWIYDAFRISTDSELHKKIYNASRICLIKGFGDDDSRIVAQLVSFFNSPDRLTDVRASERVTQMFGNLLHPEQKSFLYIFPDLLLSMTEKSPDFLSKMYENPLDECVFNELTIDTSWRSQLSSAPMWVETLTSSMASQSQGEPRERVPQNFLRATQSTFSFAPTQDIDGPGKTNATSLIVVESMMSQQNSRSSSLSYRQTDPAFGKNLLSRQSPKKETFLPPDSFIRIGKRFVKSSDGDNSADTSYERYERSKVHFARLHQKKLTRQDELEKERKGRRQAQVNLMRKYRVGELPDIQITFADVIRPLRNLCYRDEQFSRVLTVELVGSLARDSAQSCATNLQKSLVALVNREELADRTLTATVLESLLLLLAKENQDSEQEKLIPEKLVSLCRNHELESLGILILETLASRQKPSDDAEVPRKRARLETQSSQRPSKMSDVEAMCSIELYKSMGDLTSAREFYLQSLDSGSDAKNALTYETLGNYQSAKTFYQNLCHNQKSDLESKFWKESYVNCLENLSEWETLSNYVNVEMGSDPAAESKRDPWKDSFLLPHLVSSNLRLLPVGKGLSLFKTINDLRKSDAATKKSFEKRFGLELALLYISQSKLSDAKYWSERCTTDYLSDWSVRNEFSNVGYQKALSSLQRLAQVKQFLENPDSIDSFPSVSIDPSDCLIKWLYYVSDRTLCLSHLKKNDSISKDDLLASKVESLLKVSAEALQRKNYPVSIKLLPAINAELVEMDDKRSLDVVYNKTYYQVSTLRVEIDETFPLDRRFNILYGFLLKLGSSNFNDSETMAEMLHVLSKLVKKFQIPSGETEIDWIAKSSFPDQKDAKKLGHFRKLTASLRSKEDLRFKLESMSIETLKTAIQDNGAAGNPEKKFSLTSFYYDIWNQFPNQRSVDLAKTLIGSHFDSLRSGSKMALKLFPNLLSFLEEATDPNVMTHFATESKNTESWFFVPWLNQILAMFGGCSNSVCQSLGPLLLTVAREYPEAIRFPFQFTLDHVSASGNGNLEMKSYLQQLKSTLQGNTLLDQVMSGLSNLCVPEVKGIDYLESLTKCLSSKLINLEQKRIECRTLTEKYAKEFENLSDERIGGRSHADFGKKFGTQFAKIFKQAKSISEIKKVQSEANALKSALRERSSEGAVQSQNLQNFTKSRGRPPHRFSKLLKDYSPFLHSFNMSQHFDTVEMFGQYVGYRKPDPLRHVKISSFKEYLSVFGSIRKPVKIEIIGDNGRSYEWIIKCGEDLRQDQRIQQVFGIANDILSEKKDHLVPIRTYKVVPISSRLGVIEFLPNTTTYKSMAATKPVPVTYAKVSSDKDFVESIKNKTCGSKFRSFIETDCNGCQDLKQSFQKLSSSPEGFFYLRNNFLSSHGTSSLVSWIMTIGDRHADNLLISKLSGESIPIDFGHAFGSTFFLLVPELVPFRLTPQIQSLSWPFESHGPLRSAMIKTLQAMAQSQDILLAALSVFIKEPTLDWLDYAKRNAEAEKLSLKNVQEEYPRKKIEIVRRKLNCGHPCQILMDELRQGKDYKVMLNDLVMGPQRSVRWRTLATLDEDDEDDDLMEEDNQAKEREEGQNTSYEDQVDCLIELATDDELLSRAYFGWSPWI